MSEIRVPGVLEPVTGWRAWRVHNKSSRELPCLSAYSFNSGGWFLYPGTIWAEPWKALCYQDGPRTLKQNKHRAPAEKCRCGFYACKNLNDLYGAVPWRSRFTTEPTIAIGKATFWGEVRECGRDQFGYEGYRAEFAKPLSIWLLFPKRRHDFVVDVIMPLLEKRYDIPVSDAWPYEMSLAGWMVEPRRLIAQFLEKVKEKARV